MTTDGAPLPANAVHPETRAAWRAWLQKHHGRSEGVWLVLWKKASGQPVRPYDDLVEEALAFGWVDSKPRKLDAERSMLWIAPRKPGSAWSGPNKRRVEAMLAKGAMASAGLAKVQAAKADGTWTKLDAVEALAVPPDLAEAFARHAGSADAFAGFPPSARRGILEWIVQARRPETRAKRVDETARLAARGERANAWKGSAAPAKT